MDLPPRRFPGRFLAPVGLRKSPLRRLDTHPLAEFGPERRHEQERVREATSIRDEPEVIHDDAILRDYAQVADLHRSQQHALDVAAAQQLRPMLELEDRIRDIRRRARYAHVDLSRETYLMERDVARAKAGGRRPPVRVLDRAEGLESLLDGIAA